MSDSVAEIVAQWASEFNPNKLPEYVRAWEKVVQLEAFCDDFFDGASIKDFNKLSMGNGIESNWRNSCLICRRQKPSKTYWF